MPRRSSSPNCRTRSRASTSWSRARRARCRSSASAWSNARSVRVSTADVHRRPRRAARRRARGRPGSMTSMCYTVDDLGAIVQSGTEAANAAVAQAEAIIERACATSRRGSKARRAVPVIQGLRTRADVLRRPNWSAPAACWRGEAPEAVLEALSQALTNKFLHDPMAALREAGDDAERARPSGPAGALLLPLRRLASPTARRSVGSLPVGEVTCRQPAGRCSARRQAVRSDRHRQQCHEIIDADQASATRGAPRGDRRRAVEPRTPRAT